MRYYDEIQPRVYLMVNPLACACAEVDRLRARLAAAAHADAAYARTATLKKCADIVRKHYPKPPE